MALTDSDTLNYVGDLHEIGDTSTPFLNMIGGLGNVRTYNSFLFPLAQPWALASASQLTQSEDTAAAAGTAVTTTRGQDLNTVQIMKYDVAVTYAKQSRTSDFAGAQIIGNQPVQSELGFQKAAQLKQMALDIDYSCLNGAYTAPSTSATNQKTRGIIAACTTNTVSAESADLTKALIDELLREIIGSGGIMQNLVIFANTFQVQMISDIYGFAPESRTVGGVAIDRIITSIGNLSVVRAPNVPAATLLIAEMAVCSTVFVPVSNEILTSESEGGNLVSFTPIGTVAAKRGGFWYCQVGIDYGPEEYHGTITGLTTS